MPVMPGPRLFVLGMGVLWLGGGMFLSAQEALTVAVPAKDASLAEEAWSVLKKGNLSASARYRFEVFQRDQLAYPHTAEASTLRLALGYETPSVYGFSAFAEYEGVFVLGLDQYDVPGSPGQTKLGYPSILDPAGNELNQGWARWKWADTNWQVALTGGRQEIVLNDGRFLSISPWRQNHQSFDAAQAVLGFPYDFGLTYAYLDRVYRVVGEDAVNGKPPMNSHLVDLRWKRKDRVNVSAYGLLLDYDERSLYYQSTRTFGLRCTGPWKINEDWGVYYTAEGANQQDFAHNPYKVNANYWLGELGGIYKGQTVKGGVAWLGGRSATDKLTTPLAHPFNGWTELFSANPSRGTSHGLQALYLSAGGAVPVPDGLSYSMTFYQYYSANDGAHYGEELDFGLIWKVKPVWQNWEIGSRFAYYWAGTLFGNAVRASVFTSVRF